MTFNCSHLFGIARSRASFVSLCDVSDAFELARSVKKRDEREAIYFAYGLDMDKVEKYFPMLQRLEASYKKSQHFPAIPRPTPTLPKEGPASPALSLSLGAWKMYIVKEPPLP